MRGKKDSLFCALPVPEGKKKKIIIIEAEVGEMTDEIGRDEGMR